MDAIAATRPEPAELAPILARIAPPPTLHEVARGDHSFKVGGRDPAKQAGMHDEIQRAIVRWMRAIAPDRADAP